MDLSYAFATFVRSGLLMASSGMSIASLTLIHISLGVAPSRFAEPLLGQHIALITSAQTGPRGRGCRLGVEMRMFVWHKRMRK